MDFFRKNDTFVKWNIINAIISVGIAFGISYVMYYQLLLIFLDKVKIEKQNEELSFLAYYDHLTSLLNHRQINQVLSDFKEKSIQNGEPLSIAVIDIDDFKLVNDNYGHKVGDQVLFKVAELLKNNTDPLFELGRYGGDEFVIVMPNTLIEKAYEVCDCIINKVNNEDFNSINITMSCGVAELNKHNYDRFLENADFKMYDSKKQGKNRVTK